MWVQQSHTWWWAGGAWTGHDTTKGKKQFALVSHSNKFPSYYIILPFQPLYLDSVSGTFLVFGDKQITDPNFLQYLHTVLGFRSFQLYFLVLEFSQTNQYMLETT